MFDAKSEGFRHIIYTLTDQVAVFRKVTVSRNKELLDENARYEAQIANHNGPKVQLQNIHYMYLKEIKERIYHDVKSELSYLAALSDVYNNSRKRILELADGIDKIEDLNEKKEVKEEIKILFSFIDTYESYFKTLKSVEGALKGYDQNNDRYLDFIKANPDTFKEANNSAKASKDELKEKTVEFDINISDKDVSIIGKYDNVSMEKPNQYDISNIEEMDIEYFFINFLDEISEKLNIKGTDLANKKFTVRINGKEIKNVDSTTFVKTVFAYIQNQKKDNVDKATEEKNKQDEINRKVPDKETEKNKQDKKQLPAVVEKQIITLDRILADLTKDLDFEKGDDWKFTASNIRVNENFKKKVCTGNVIYNIVALAPSVVSYPFQLIHKGIGKLAYRKKIDERIVKLEDRVRNLSEEELQVLYHQYKGGNLRNYQKMPIVNTIIQARIAAWITGKIKRINARMVAIYNTILNDFKRMSEIQKRVKEGNLSEEEIMECNQEYGALLYGKADLIREYISLQNEKLDYEIGGKVGYSESIKAYKTGMSQVGFRFRKVPKESDELNEAQAKAYEEEIRGVANNNDAQALSGFLKREKLISDNTIVDGLLVQRDVGLRSYNPLVKPLNYDKDPFVSDLMRTVVLVASGINLYTTISRAHELEAIKDINQAQSDIIKQQQAEINKLYGDLDRAKDLSNSITDKAGAVEAGRIAQINEANLAHTNTLERAVLDQTNWHSTGAEYKALDDAAHATYNNAYAASQAEINSIADQVASGSISHADAMTKLTNLSNNMETQFVANYKSVFDTVKQYAENNPQFDLTAPTEGLEKVIQTSANINAGNAAVDEAFKIANEISNIEGISLAEIQAVAENLAKIEAATGVVPAESMIPGLFNSLSAACLAIGVKTRMRKYTPYMDLDEIENIDDITDEDIFSYEVAIGNKTQEEYEQFLEEQKEKEAKYSSDDHITRTAASTAANTVVIAHR